MQKLHEQVSAIIVIISTHTLVLFQSFSLHSHPGGTAKGSTGRVVVILTYLIRDKYEL